MRSTESDQVVFCSGHIGQGRFPAQPPPFALPCGFVPPSYRWELRYHRWVWVCFSLPHHLGCCGITSWFLVQETVVMRKPLGAEWRVRTDAHK